MHSQSKLTALRGTVRPFAALAVGLGLFAAGAAQAAIVYTGGSGATVYGVASYGGGPQGAPAFIANNITGFNDILATPGHGFQLADPSIPNNIAQTGIQPLGLYSFQVGGGNGNGPFGAGQTLITGPRIGFGLKDVFPAGGSASYMISSWEANFTVDGGGFLGNFGNFLAIGGRLGSPGSAAAASLVSNYYVNGVYVGQAAPLILAAAGNGNFQALGGSGAVLQFGSFGRYRGLAVNNIPAALGAGTNLRVVSTLTAFADPASIDMIDIPLDFGLQLPDFAFAGSSASVPEPSVWAVLIAGFAGVGARLRRRRALAAVPA